MSLALAIGLSLQAAPGNTRESSSVSPAGEPTTKLDVAYKTVGDVTLRLDLHYPDCYRAEERYPLVVFTHGGGWTTGSKTLGDRGVRFKGVRALTAEGFCVASVSYRLWTKDGDIMIRDCVTDAKDALRFLALNACELSLDPDRVFTVGDSAGGQIAQMLLLSPPDAFPGDQRLAGAKYTLIAGVSWYGPVDFENTDLFEVDGLKRTRDRFGVRILKPGTDPKIRIAAYREVSPVNYLRKDSPPLLLIQGDKDTTIPVKHAYFLQERAKQLDASVEIVIVRNAGHNWRTESGELDPSFNEIVARTAIFIKKRLEQTASK
ncbi:MAG: alpha/beta hydrolase [Planctomycetaceae bacterium]